jgi:hypothetical protein
MCADAIRVPADTNSGLAGATQLREDAIPVPADAFPVLADRIPTPALPFPPNS